MAHKAQGFDWIFAGSQRISALLNVSCLRHMGEFIGVQENALSMNAMEKLLWSW